jgi:hypothetical protein
VVEKPVITSYIPQIDELRLLGVYDRGIPNKERIVLKAKQNLDIGWYALILSIRGPSPGHATPMRDSLYWFGSGNVAANDWLFIYTGTGTDTKIPSNDKTCTLFIQFWNRPQTIFHNKQIVPVLWRLNGITIERNPLEPPDLK